MHHQMLALSAARGAAIKKARLAGKASQLRR
jgi:hypothetical protein